MRVLGVDPGSSATGWAVVVGRGQKLQLAASGVVRPGAGTRAERLSRLAGAIRQIVATWSPESAAVETAFSGRFPKSALQLAESRGAILAVLGEAALPVCGYSPAQVKTAVVGFGGASKEQVAYMVRRLLGLEETPPADAADAMAVALAHIQAEPLRAVTERLDPR